MAIFNKYRVRSADYHWQQLNRNIFRFNAYVAARYKQVVKLIPIKAKRILDIGCGDGVLLSLIKRGRLYGVDLDQKSLDYAATRVKAQLEKAPAEKLPFKNNYFDTVVATEIIEHLSHPKQMLTETRRVLKPDGRLIITTPVKQPVGLTDKLHHQEFSPDELKTFVGQYFRQVKIITSHPQWLKKLYCLSLGRFGKYHLDVGRWLVNLLVLISGWNPFINLPGKPTQQLAICNK